jgi:hypothetical protein
VPCSGVRVSKIPSLPLYGRPFTVISDCKPLETIFKKPLHSAPPRLQKMMIRIQGYNFEVKYCPGKEMIIADTLAIPTAQPLKI